VDNFSWPNLWITLKNSVLYQNILVQHLSPKPSLFKDIDMQIFSVVKLLIDNAYEFCPDANVSDEWQRLVYEEFYHQWLNNEVTTLSVTDFIEQRYEAFIAELSTASAKLAPVFSSKHIEKHGNQYRVRITLGNDRVVQNFDNLDDARLFRNEIVKIAQAA